MIQVAERARAMESTTRAKATALDKAIHSKDNMDLATEMDSAATKDKHTATANMQVKEEKENMRQTFATDEGSQDTW